MLANAACASRRIAAFAKCKITCWESASAAKMLQLLLVVLEVLEEGKDTKNRLDNRDQNFCRTRRKPRQEEELGRVCLRRFWHPMLEQVVEWLGDTGASRHVCNDLSLMWDVRMREKPILLRQLVGDLHVYTAGTVKLEFPNLSGGSSVVSMLETC